MIAELLQKTLWPKLSCPRDAKDHKARVHPSPCPQARIAEQCEMLFVRHFKPAGVSTTSRMPLGFDGLGRSLKISGLSSLWHPTHAWNCSDETVGFSPLTVFHKGGGETVQCDGVRLHKYFLRIVSLQLRSETTQWCVPTTSSIPSLPAWC